MAAKRGKRKNWFTILAPNFFNRIELGKTLSTDPENLIGRKVSASLMDLTNNFSKYYMKFSFKIKNVQDDKAITEFDGSECLRDYISRMVLRRMTRIDTIQDLMTKDNVKIRVKGLAVIRGRVKSSVKATIRSKIKGLIKDEVENSSLENFIENIISDKLKNKILK